MPSRKTKQLSGSQCPLSASMVKSAADVAGFAQQRPEVDRIRAALTNLEPKMA